MLIRDDDGDDVRDDGKHYVDGDDIESDLGSTGLQNMGQLPFPI